MSMFRKDLHNNTEQKIALNIQAITSDTTTAGAIIDLQGYGAIEFIVQSATLTDGTYTVKLEEGNAANLSDAAVPDTSNVFGSLPSFASTDDNVAKRVGYRVGAKRYVRLSIVSTGTTSGGTLGASALLGNADNMPTA